jgi:hypothetical protein
MANVSISEQKLTHVQVNSDGGVDWMSAPIPAGEVRPFAKDVNTAQLLELWGKGECGEEPFRVRTDMPFAPQCPCRAYHHFVGLFCHVMLGIFYEMNIT